MPTTANRGPGYRALRAHRVSLPGHFYLVTTTTHRRERLFGDFAAARTAIKALNDPETLRASGLLAWVLMPDHCHLLLQLGESDALCALVNRIKSRTGRLVNRRLKREGPVWQNGFHEHLLRKEEDLKGVARYIVMNPVRAGLVTRAPAYPHWNAMWL